MNDTDEAFELLSKFKNQDGNYPPEFKKAQYSAQIAEARPKGTKIWFLLN